MNTQALFCLSLPLVIAGCAQQTSTSTARDSAFAQSLRPPVFSDIYQRSPEVTRSGRYTLVSVKSADAQREPLNQLIDITMPGQLVNSVGDGFRYLLFQSGYSLCGRYGADFAELLKRPLPAVQRKIGPMRLSEALQVVAGPAWRMSVDEVNREVCFVLRDAYLAQAKTTASATPTLKSSDTAGVYVSPETSRNPYTGVLPGKNAVPVVAGQLLTSKKDTAQKPVSEFLPVSTVTEPEVFRRTRNRFNQWLQTEFDRHYHTMRDGGYRSFLKKNHPTELERYDEACEALRREEFARFAELQTLGLYLHLQVQQKEAQFRRRRNRLLLGMTITGVMTSVLLYANFYPEQLQLISHELATLPGRISGFVGRLLH